MAHSVKRPDGSVVWCPDYVKVPDPVLLDPNLSPMENAWRVVNICASVWLAKFKIWASEKEDVEDLEQTARFMTMQELIRRVRKKKYNRKYSFYLNCRSCAYSIMLHRVIDPWVAHIKERDAMLDGHAPAGLKCDENFTLYDVISMNRQHCWITDAERRYKRVDWRDAARPGDKLRLLEKQIEDDYDQHCDDCTEFGLEPMDKDSFIDENYTESEKALFDTPLYRHNAYMRDYAKRKMVEDPDYRARKQEYNRQYYASKKAKKATQ